MSARRSLALLVVVGLAGLIGYLVLARSRATEADAPQPEEERASLTSNEPTGERRLVDVEPSPEIGLPEAPSKGEPMPGASPATFQESLELTGRVVLSDARGNQLPPVDGRLTLAVFSGKTGQHLDIDVVAGQWRTTVHQPERVSRLWIAELTAGDLRLVIDTPREVRGFPEDRFLEIRAHLPGEATLRVVDARSGLDLAGITLLHPQGFFEEDGRQHPGVEYETRAAARGLRSPIDLREHLGADEANGTQKLPVGVQGYAWGLAAIDFDRGSERVVALDAGGDLEVIVTGVDPESHAELRLRPAPDESPYAVTPLERDGSIVFRDLLPQTYIVRAEVGDWFDDPLVLARERVKIAAGVTARLTLALPAAPRLELAAAQGVVLIPKAWGMDRISLSADLLDTPLAGQETHQRLNVTRSAQLREGFDVFTWHAPPLQVGRHELELFDPRFSIVIEVPPGGSSDFELIVPPPVELRIRIIDDATGTDVAGVACKWHPRRPYGVSSGGLEEATYDALTKTYVIRAVEDVIGLMIWDWKFQPYQGEVDAAHGAREATVRLKRACGLTLTLKDGDTLVPLPDYWDNEVRAVEGTVGEGSLQSHGSGSLRLMVTAPGTYELTPPKIDGYLQPPVQRIVVLPGEFTAHVVALEREHP